MQPVGVSSTSWGNGEDEGAVEEFKRLTAVEADALRRSNPPLSPWVIVGLQGVMGVLVALSGGWWMDSMPVLWSAGYGTLVVAVPAAFMAWGLRKRVDDNHAGAGAVRFMSWEFVKIAGSLGMLAAAPWVLQPISWPALVAGLVVGTKVYWLALLLQRRRR